MLYPKFKTEKINLNRLSVSHIKILPGNASKMCGGGGVGSKFFFKMFPALRAGITYPKNFPGASRQKNIPALRAGKIFRRFAPE